MVLFALVEQLPVVRKRQRLWFLDNVAAVMTLVSRDSSNVT